MSWRGRGRAVAVRPGGAGRPMSRRRFVLARRLLLLLRRLSVRAKERSDRASAFDRASRVLLGGWPNGMAPVRSRGQPTRPAVSSPRGPGCLAFLGDERQLVDLGRVPPIVGAFTGVATLAPPAATFPGRHSPARFDLDASGRLFERRVLDQGDDAACHEATRPDGRAAARELGHLDDAARRRHLEPAAGARGQDLEGLRPVARVDDDLDPIALHTRILALRPLRRNERAARRRCRPAAMQAGGDRLRIGALAEPA